jgi:flagellar biosynthesis protein FlhG
MQDELYIKCCAILEVSPDASTGEIKRSYLYLKELYSADSIASMALEDELSVSDKKEILAEIEQAFHRLMALDKQERELPGGGGGEPCDDEAVAEIISGIDVFDGAALKQIREKMGVALDDIAVATRIQRQYFTALEDENFDALPAEVYTRGFVTNYAEFLSLDVQKVVADYMGRYRRWKSDNRQGGTIATLFSMFKSRR